MALENAVAFAIAVLLHGRGDPRRVGRRRENYERNVMLYVTTGRC
jgi:hypothetical protein